MSVKVIAWHDVVKNDYRALVDAEYPEGTKRAAARGDTPVELKTWLTAILENYSDAGDVTLINCGDMAGPSFEAVRTKAMFAPESTGSFE